MTTPILHFLSTEQFNDNIGFVLPPVPMRHLLQKDSAVRALASGLRYGSVLDAEVRKFVSTLLNDFRAGEIFRHDIALAAIAVAMEHWQTPFAEEYLLDLAGVGRSEFRCSFRVAQECLKARYAFPRTEVRTVRYPQGTSEATSAQGVCRVLAPYQRLDQEDEVRWVRFEPFSTPSEAANAVT